MSKAIDNGRMSKKKIRRLAQKDNVEQMNELLSLEDFKLISPKKFRENLTEIDFQLPLLSQLECMSQSKRLREKRQLRMQKRKEDEMNNTFGLSRKSRMRS